MNMCRNIEWGIRICLGPKRSSGEEPKLLEAHFPYLTKSENRFDVAIMNQLRAQAFMCPHITDLEKYRDPEDPKAALNVYEKGVFFSDMIVSEFF